MKFIELATFLAALVVSVEPHEGPIVLSVAPSDVELGYRLPNSTFPVRYDVVLRTHIHLEDENRRFSFEGSVEIHLKAASETSEIVIHQRNLTILDAELKRGSVQVQSWQGSEVDYDDKFEFLTFNLDTPLSPEETYTLEISYRGTLRELRGFYRSSYEDAVGKRRWLATTQFSQTDARHAFPCYDEPGIRAPIGLSIIHGSEYFAIANTPEKGKTPDEDGYVKTSFLDTPSMPTYILGFLICDYDFMEVHGDVPQRAFAYRQAIESGLADFGLQTGVRVQKQMDSYLGMNYSFYNRKLDHAVIPDFFYSAMENWGIITYRESAFFFDPQHSTWTDKHSIASTIGHEYTHHYFGNLVSVAWWSYVWLKEGFANLYGWLSLREIYPEFQDREMYQLLQLQTVMEVDGWGVTRAMTSYAEAPAAVGALFDSIAYPKSGSVIRMWLHALGESTWRKGLNHYLTDMASKAATAKDLARGLQKAVNDSDVHLDGLTMEEIVLNWSLNPGYPVIFVSLGDDNKLRFNQSEFLLSEAQPKKEKLWLIPVTVASRSSPEFERDMVQFWITQETHEQAEVRERGLKWDSDDWIIVNPKQTGYYRVNYEAKLWTRIIQQLTSSSFSDIHHQSRSHLLNDAFALARAELLDYRTVLNLLSYLGQEKHYLPWDTASIGLAYLHRLLLGSSTYDSFRSFVQGLVRPLFEHYGLRDFGNTEVWGDKRARETAISWACRVGIPECQEETRKMMLQAFEGGLQVVPDLQQVVFCGGLRNSPREEFVEVMLKQQKEPHFNTRLRLLGALGCNERSENQETILETMVSDLKYSTHEFTILVMSVYSNSINGTASTIAFFSKHSEQIETRYGILKAQTAALANVVSTKELLDQYRGLLNDLFMKERITEEEVQAYSEIAETNLRWLEKNEDEIGDALKDILDAGTDFGTPAAAVSGALVTFSCLLSLLI